MSGFFSTADLTRKFKVSVNTEDLHSNCTSCGIHTQCRYPKMDVTGEGKKQILVIGDYTTDDDDEYGMQFVGPTGDILKDELKANGINLNTDCWKINAVRCRVASGTLPTHAQIKHCYPHIEKTILELKPKLIIVLGDLAITSLFGTDFSDRKAKRWRVYCIPDEKFKCNVVPLHSPNYLARFEKDKNLKMMFKRDVKLAVSCINRPFIKRLEYESYCTNLTDFIRVKKLLKRIIKRKSTITYDYESTGLKPFRKGHKIVSIGIAVSATKAFAFPYMWKSHWTRTELKAIKKLWSKILSDDEIKKIVHNAKFEEVWSTVMFNVRPHYHFDTMMAEHCFPKEVEFLTDNGWKSCKDVNKNDLIAQVDLNNNREISYANPIKVIKSQTNELAYVTTKTLSLCCTPNHDIVRGVNCGKRFEKITIKKALTDFKEITFLGAGNMPDNFRVFSTQILQLYASFLSDGYFLKRKKGVRKQQYYGIGYVFKKNRKIEKLKDILESNKLAYTHKIRSDGATVFKIYNTKLGILLNKLFPLKQLSFQFENQLEKKEIQIFIDTFNFFDGSYLETLKWNNIVAISQTKECNIDVLQSMMCKIGYRTKKTEQKRVTEYGYVQSYTIRGNKKGYTTCQFKNAKMAEIKRTENTTNVYCVTMPKGTLITRYKGSVLVMGNCLDNRSASTGLKFQTFVRFGVRPYDKHIKQFLKAKNGEFNTIEKAPLKDILSYNNLDCIFAFMLWDRQIVQLTQNRGLLKAYNFFVRGNKQMATLQLNGIAMNTKYYQETEKLLQAKVDKRKKYLEEGREARAFKKKYLRPININSNQDLGKLFYEVLGKTPIYTNEKQINYKTDKTTLESLDLPFVEKLLEMKKYEKANGTYLGQFAREIYRGKMYPFFDLNIPVTYRGSSSKPNFQNLPKRDAEIKALIRMGIIPNLGCVISEIDFSGAEVITSATYHLDPTFIHDITIGDMHRDLAIEIWMLPPDMMDKKKNPNYTDKELKMIKDVRFFAKNDWTFAQLYGDWFGSCGKMLWEDCIAQERRLPNGHTLKSWLETKGIYELGEITKQGPTEGSFLEHLKNVEEKMWNERWPQYTQWRKDIVDFYQQYGYIENHFGFRFKGLMNKNQCTNFPIQSASFHILVHTLIEVQKFIDENKLKTKIIGQVHDSIISNVPEDEIKFYHAGVNKIVKGLQKTFKWLIIPMEIEAEISKLREDGGNFAELKEVDPDDAKLCYKKAA